jgi:hypothetical protein
MCAIVFHCYSDTLFLPHCFCLSCEFQMHLQITLVHRTARPSHRFNSNSLTQQLTPSLSAFCCFITTAWFSFTQLLQFLIRLGGSAETFLKIRLHMLTHHSNIGKGKRASNVNYVTARRGRGEPKRGREMERSWERDRCHNARTCASLVVYFTMLFQ